MRSLPGLAEPTPLPKLDMRRWMPEGFPPDNREED